MPIVVTIDAMLARRKMSLKELGEYVGITPVNMSRLKTGNAKGFRFETLNSICEKLECQPGDLLMYMTPLEYHRLLVRQSAKQGKRKY